MTPDQNVPLDSVRVLLLRVWRSMNRRDAIPMRTLEDCFRSFGLEVPLCELHRRDPDLGIVIRWLESLEVSLMGVETS